MKGITTAAPPIGYTTPGYPDEVYVDVRLAKEPSVTHEFYVQIVNLLNTRTIQFNNLSTGGRETQAGFTVRF